MRPFAIEAVRTLSQSPLPARFAFLSKLATDRDAPLPLRAEAIVGLADDAANQRQTLLALATGQQAELRREALAACGVSRSRNRRSPRYERRAARTLRRSSCWTVSLRGGHDRLASPPDGLPPWTSTPGSVFSKARPTHRQASESFFHSKGPGCYRCHQVNGRGGRAGPDLSTLAAGMDRRRLVESILTPSKEIAPQFVAWSVARTDGTVFTGILLEQSPEGSLVFADAQGRLIAVKTDEIAERKPQTTSIMPDNLAQTMTLQDFRDLVAFLWRRK